MKNARQTITIALLAALAAWAGPAYYDLQSLGMGRTGTAMAEGRKALYINPAGLRHMPLPFSMGLPISLGIGNFAFEGIDFLNKNRDMFEQGIEQATPERVTIFYDDLRKFDRKDFVLDGQLEGGLATRVFGLGGYIIPEVRGRMDMGIFNPWMQAQFGLDLVLQAGLAAGKWNSWSVGLAPKILGQVLSMKTVVPASQMFDKMDSAAAASRGEAAPSADPFSKFDSTKTIGAFALDLGFQKRHGRHAYGVAIKDLGKGKGTLTIKPTLNLGYAWKADTTVKSFWRRKTILAADIRDIGAPGHLLSKLNVGLEKKLSLWFLLDTSLRAGASGGYPTLGIGFGILKAAHLDYATYADEAGDYPGQKMERKHLFELALGF